jgi:hypothetical protein
MYSSVAGTIIGNVSFACVADLAATGQPNLMVGTVYPATLSGQVSSGYALYLNKNGAIARKVCWGNPSFCPP